jgi:hypothetical protein
MGIKCQKCGKVARAKSKPGLYRVDGVFEFPDTRPGTRGAWTCNKCFKAQAKEELINRTVKG